MPGDHPSSALSSKEMSCATDVQLEGAMDRWVWLCWHHQCNKHSTAHSTNAVTFTYAKSSAVVESVSSFPVF